MTKHTPPAEAASPKGDATSEKKRGVRLSAELLGLPREELEAMGEAVFESLLVEAFEQEVAQRMVSFDAALDAADLLIGAGRWDDARTLLRQAATALGQRGVEQKDISRRYARMIFGPRSERLTTEQRKQLFLAFGGDALAFDTAEDKGETPLVPTPEPPTEPTDAEDPRADAPPAGETPVAPEKKKRPGHHGRAPIGLTDAVRRLVTSTPVADEDRICAICGNKKICMHPARTEWLEFRAAEIVLCSEEREQVACPTCRKDVVTAPPCMPSSNRRRVGPSVVADLIVEKCSEAQPMHRERMRYKRMGWTVAASTLDSAWRWGTTLLSPVADVCRGELLAHDYVSADSTPFTVLDSKHPKGRFKGQIWTFVAGGEVAFTFAANWSAPAIADSFLVCPDGYKQGDDYAGFGREFEHNGAPVRLIKEGRRLGCAMHIRRRFFEALEAREMRAAVPVELFRLLYQVEREAKDKSLTHEQRRALRLVKSAPLLESFRAWLDAHVGKLNPASTFGRAVSYADHQWPFFLLCFSRGDFEIDNGACEREIRTIAIGRKNFLFSGSIDAAKRLCSMYTLVVGAKRHGLDPFVYIRDLLQKLDDGWPITRVSELTPTRWKG